MIKHIANGKRYSFGSHRSHVAWLGRHFRFGLVAISQWWVGQAHLLRGRPSRQVATCPGLKCQTVTGILHKRVLDHSTR